MSKKFETVKKYFDMDLWTVAQVYSAVNKGWITEKEFALITKMDYNNLQ